MLAGAAVRGREGRALQGAGKGEHCKGQGREDGLGRVLLVLGEPRVQEVHWGGFNHLLCI